MSWVNPNSEKFTNPFTIIPVRENSDAVTEFTRIYVSHYRVLFSKYKEYVSPVMDVFPHKFPLCLQLYIPSPHMIIDNSHYDPIIIPVSFINMVTILNNSHENYLQYYFIYIIILFYGLHTNILYICIITILYRYPLVI